MSPGAWIIVGYLMVFVLLGTAVLAALFECMRNGSTWNADERRDEMRRMH